MRIADCFVCSVLASAVLASACTPSRSPAATIRRMVDAQTSGDVETLRANTVSPEELARLLRCPDRTTSQWNTVSERRKTINEMIAHGAHCGAAPRGLTLESFDGEYYPNEWRSYQPGDHFGDCTVQAPFAVERYRIVLASHDTFASNDARRSHKPAVLWRIGDAWRIWEDPLRDEGCD